MAKNSAVNLDITNNADGYDIAGGTTIRKLTLTGADITLTGSGSNTFTYPDSSDTLVGRDSTDTLTNKTINTASNTITIAASDVSDFDTEVSNNSSVTANTAKTGVTTQISNVVEDTTPQLGGDLDWNSNGMKLVSQTVAGSNGNAMYLSGSTTWSTADSSAEATVDTMIAIRISATEVLTHGVYTTTGLTAGSIYYISETAGAITTTKPTTTGTIVRIIGYALSTTELFVDPDKTYIEN